MIPGDIDLTEKLDFRKAVKKELPQLPSTWNKSNINTINYNTTDIGTFTISTTLNNTTYRSNITVHRPNRFEWFDGYYGTEIDNIIYWTSDNYYTISCNGNDYDYTSTSSSYVRQLPTIEESEYDVFGNKKKVYTEDIPKIPWGKNLKIKYDSIPWFNNHLYTWTRKKYDYKIPWDIDYYDEDTYDLTDTTDRAMCLISWLSDKSRRFIQKYFETDDNIDLSYLTNMNWIRVKDAVID